LNVIRCFPRVRDSRSRPDRGEQFPYLCRADQKHAGTAEERGKAGDDGHVHENFLSELKSSKQIHLRRSLALAGNRELAAIQRAGAAFQPELPGGALKPLLQHVHVRAGAGEAAVEIRVI